ncbi:hypothetical protein BRADI_2g41245v3 [Brachypodium distachyon]|uniref:Uncharacterized protein n=1 Tax=Brachypodium distachyon TaxID=15368 RepID=A0A2K2DD46_BRADI|nr:hypothetical protein BRADI_2g41245v3 [Brachypodium distachyon]
MTIDPLEVVQIMFQTCFPLTLREQFQVTTPMTSSPVAVSFSKVVFAFVGASRLHLSKSAMPADWGWKIQNIWHVFVSATGEKY